MTELPIKNLKTSLNHVPEPIKSIHILGICGTGMAALAGMLQKDGYNVQGSDSHVYPPMSDFLEQLGIVIHNGYSAENLATKPDLVIVGNVIRQVNPEAQALAESDIPYLSFPQALAHFFIQGKTSLVVSGTHGKTTTCSLLASALYHAELDPTFMIGGIVREFNSNFRIGAGEYFVAEGDEYDTAFFDKESKFLHYRPSVAIITSLEFDHADIFEDLDAIKKAFKKFVSLLPKDGLIVANFDDTDVIEVIQDAPCKVISYGLGEKNFWSIQDISINNGVTTFTALKNSNPFFSFSVRLPGTHNALNTLSVIAVLDYLGYPAERFESGLLNFGGVKRRQEIRGIENSVTVIDDFAHHPTAVLETLKALKKSYSSQRLIAVFEPRTNSSRRSIFQKDYVKAFDAADLVIIREPVPLESYSVGDLFSAIKLSADLSKRGVKNVCFGNATEILDYLAKELQAEDIVAVLSNGGFENIHERLLEQLRNQN